MIGFLAMANTPLGWGAALPMNRAPSSGSCQMIYIIIRKLKTGYT